MAQQRKIEKMRKALMRSNTRLLLTAVVVLQALSMLLIAIQQIDSNLIYPKLVGSSMGLHPVTVLTAVFAGGVFWGTAGMLLAVPAAAFLKVLAKKVLSFWPD